MAAIPEDMVIEIISRLPTKSLHRFQCVSKLWTNIVTHISSQRTTLLPMSGLFFYQSRDSKELEDHDKNKEGFYTPTSHRFEDDEDFKSRLSRFPFYPKASLMDTCNGLFLFVNRDFDNQQIKIYYVCNPATNEFVTLPDPPINDRPPNSYLAFDPRVSPNYKVVLFNFNDQRNHVIVVMYSSMTGRWAMFTRRLTGFNIWKPEMVFHKRALYMITSQLDLLIRFDTDQGSFHATKLPKKQFSSLFTKGHIGESRGRLCYAANELCPASELRIYMLDEEGTDEWLLMHIVRTTKEIPHFFYGAKAFHPDSEVIYISIPGKILSCNLSSGMIEEIWSIDGDVTSGMIEEIYPIDGFLAHNIFPVIYCLESLNPTGGRFISPLALDDK